MSHPKFSRWPWTLALILWVGGMALMASCAPKAAPVVRILEPVPEEALAELHADGGVPRVVMPKKPLDWQKKPPCDAEMGEEAVLGACYVQVANRRPPCGRLIEHAGACYRAIAKVPRTPTSLSP